MNRKTILGTLAMLFASSCFAEQQMPLSVFQHLDVNACPTIAHAATSTAREYVRTQSHPPEDTACMVAAMIKVAAEPEHEETDLRSLLEWLTWKPALKMDHWDHLMDEASFYPAIEYTSWFGAKALPDLFSLANSSGLEDLRARNATLAIQEIYGDGVSVACGNLYYATFTSALADGQMRRSLQPDLAKDARECNDVRLGVDGFNKGQ